MLRSAGSSRTTYRTPQTDSRRQTYAQEVAQAFYNDNLQRGGSLAGLQREQALFSDAQTRERSQYFQAFDKATGLALTSGRAGVYASSGKIQTGARVGRSNLIVLNRNSDRK